MDIFEQAKKFDADYYDPHTGYIYLIQHYNQLKRAELPVPGINVIDPEGNYIGIVQEPQVTL
jgi:hypothetical protein